MCLAIIALNAHPEWPLIIVANRDELHGRPTRAACPWEEAPHLLGGRDLHAGGTWLGMTASGRITLLTNVREPAPPLAEAPSRGKITERYLRGELSAQDYAQSLEAQGASYNGFNIVLGDHTGLWYYSNRGATPIQQIRSGVMGLSNASLNTPWPKLTRTQTAVAKHLTHCVQPSPERLFEIFQDTREAEPHELPNTGLALEREKLLSSPFIRNERYGTRCTTLIMKGVDGKILFHEKRYDAEGQLNGENRWLIDTLQHTFDVAQ